MAGHSKWAQIKHRKSATDAKKGKLFSKLAKLITIAAKNPPIGRGPDPKINSKLAATIQEAKAQNMPNENIERAIKSAAEKDAVELKEVVYEAYGPGGSALIITAVTDNGNRTTNEIKHLLSEHEAKLSEQGSVIWAFTKQEKEYTPNFPMELSKNNEKQLDALLEALNNHDDIQEVYSNIK